MACRPVFYASPLGNPEPVSELQVEFKWFPGFSVQQKQKSIASLHDRILGSTTLARPLEISSKSLIPLGVQLSAFNLQLSVRTPSVLSASVETVYQGSKVFGNRSRADTDRFSLDSRDSRQRVRELEEKAAFTGWEIGSYRFPLSSGVDFYNWLYLGALHQQPSLLCQIEAFDCFTDIEFNPKKSLACQARSAALAKSLTLREGGILPYLRRIARAHACNDSNNSPPLLISNEMRDCVQLALDY